VTIPIEAGASPPVRPRVALIVPTLNEEEAIGPTLAAVPPGAVDRVVVADGGSTDRTVERARAAGADVVSPGRGFGLGCLAAARLAEGAEILVFMDGDGADDPAAIPILVEPIARGAADLVIGSRTIGWREPGSLSWHQVAAGRAAGLGMRLLYGTRFTDMCTFRAICRDVLLELGMTEMTYGWNLEMQMRAARAGLTVVEIPVPYRRRRGGESKVAGNLRGSLKAGLRIVATFVRVALQPAPPANAQSGVAVRQPGGMRS
jgi:glycosyltransferase involved in cell wall biosynthesis